MKPSVAVYAGTFDPPTNGHLWMVRQGAALFGKLIVAIGVNPEKRCMFLLDERQSMLTEVTRDLPNVSVSDFTNEYLIRYAQSVGARFILRGVRNSTDYEYERGMRNVNGDIDSGITTVFLMPPRDMAEVSSSLVKGLIGPKGWRKLVRGYVPPPVFARIKGRKP